MKQFSFGDIVLLAFPFTNHTEIKKRPALVIFDSEDNDLIVARVTSQISKDEFDYLITSWKDCGLLLPSVVKFNKIATVEKSLISKRIGAISMSEKVEAIKIFKKICESI